MSGRSRYVPKDATPPEIVDAIGRILALWRGSVHSILERLAGIPAGKLAFQTTSRRARCVEIVLRGLYNRTAIDEATLARAIEVYARHIEKTAWYHDDPFGKIFAIDRLLGDEGELLKWVGKATAATVADERAAEQRLMAGRKRAEADRLSAIQADQATAVAAELDRLRTAEPETLAAMERDALARMGPVARQAAERVGRVTAAENQIVRAIVTMTITDRLFPTPARSVGSALAGMDANHDRRNTRES